MNEPENDFSTHNKGFKWAIIYFILIKLHRLRNKLIAYINENRCLLLVDLTSTGTVSVDASQRQNLLSVFCVPFVNSVDLDPPVHMLVRWFCQFAYILITLSRWTSRSEPRLFINADLYFMDGVIKERNNSFIFFYY